MSEQSGGDNQNPYQDFERKTVEAFNQWHAFHENLLGLGDFSTWLSDPENQIDLVTFFALDKENAAHYREALEHQSAFLGAMNDLVVHVRAMLEEYENKPG